MLFLLISVVYIRQDIESAFSKKGSTLAYFAGVVIGALVAGIALATVTTLWLTSPSSTGMFENIFFSYTVDIK